MSSVMVVTFLAFMPSLQNGFVYWDDHVVLLENYNYRGFDSPRLHWMFTTGFMGHYQPLTWLSYAADYALWGMQPWGYHLTSLILHVATAAVFFWIARHLLTRALSSPAGNGIGLEIASGLAAILFAIHPLRVESVAWATERRDLTSGLFFMITLAAYLQAVSLPHRPRARRRWLILSISAYALSLLGKVIGVSVPILLVVLDAYPLRRLERFPKGWTHAAVRNVWKEKVPYLMLAIVAAANAFLVQYNGPAISSLSRVPWMARLSMAAYGTAQYLYTSLVPLSLSPLYAPDSPFDPFAWYFLLSGCVLIIITAVVVLTARRWPAGAALWVAYLAMLAPVVGVVQIGPQIAADRYSYLSCLGWALLGGAAWLAVWNRRPEHRKWGARPVLASLAATSLVIALGCLTWRQVHVWHDTGSLWEQALRVDPHNGMAHSALGNWLDRQGKLTQALEHHRLGVQYRPELADGHSDMGVTLAKLGRYSEAIEAFHTALQKNPLCLSAHNGLGIILTSSGVPSQTADGVKHYEEALRIRPTFTIARRNLADHHLRAGNPAQAEAVLRDGLRLAPMDASLASTLNRLQRAPIGTVRPNTRAVAENALTADTLPP